MKPNMFMLAAIKWLCYTTKRTHSFYTNPSRYTAYWYFLPRWWLPFFWMLWILAIPLFLLEGGICDWWHQLMRQFNPSKQVNYSRQGYGDLPTKWADKVRWWYKTYTR